MASGEFYEAHRNVDDVAYVWSSRQQIPEKMSLRTILNQGQLDPVDHRGRHVPAMQVPRDDRKPHVLPYRPPLVAHGARHQDSSSQDHGAEEQLASLHHRPRPPRFRYSEEELHFVWYHKIDLGLPWDKIKKQFARQFATRSLGGLQCRFYRTMEECGFLPVRDQKKMNRRSGDSNPELKTRFMDTYDQNYPWMLYEHQLQQCWRQKQARA